MCAPNSLFFFRGGIHLFSNDPDILPLSSMTKLLPIFRWLMLSCVILTPYIFLKM